MKELIETLEHVFGKSQIIVLDSNMCEDFPCCGHELGCCPDFDESGKQLNMVCVCGFKLPIDNKYSICNECLKDNNEE